MLTFDPKTKNIMATSTTQRKIGIYLSPIRRGTEKMTVVEK